MNKLKTQYLATKPRASTIEVEEGCFLYLEEFGHPEGIPVVFIHGGPGNPFLKTDHQWFDPEKYRIILFQQRGTGKCIPSAEDLECDASVFKNVTIQTLAQDVETIKKTLNIEKWLVFGGSWGSTLSLFYAQEYPKSCLGLVLRGIFLGTQDEKRDFFNPEILKKSCGEDWDPKALKRIIDYATSQGFEVDPKNSCSLYSAYREMTVNRNDIRACRLWASFERFVDDPANKGELERVLSDSLETTPLERSCAVWETLMFDQLPRTVNLLDEKRLIRLKELPIQVVHGKKDNLCLWQVADELVDKLKKEGCRVRFDLIENGAHTPYHPEMTHALVSATDRFAVKGKFLAQKKPLK